MARDHARRIVIVCPTLLRNDAVGSSTITLFRDLVSDPANHVTLIARNSDPQNVPVTLIRSVGDLLLSQAFIQADVLIYIFAIYNDLFDVMLLGNGQARQIVRFHNVTPKAFVGEKDHPIIDRSMAQIQNFGVADELWADSQENQQELIRQGLDPDRIRVMDLAVTPHVFASLADKPTDVVRLIYVGRFVQSKGVHELLEAMALLRQRTRVPFHLRLLGNTRHATAEYLTRLDRRMTDLDLHDVVEIGGTVTDEVLAQAYGAAHVLVTASRHEGFCVPVIEGLAAGCVPVSYANSNLRYIGGGLSRLADDQTPEALAEALRIVVEGIAGPSGSSSDRTLALDRGAMSVNDFDAAARTYALSFGRETAAARVHDRLAALAPVAITPAIG